MSQEEKSPRTFSDLVVVGSSAGGIEALSVLVSTLPKDFSAPVVLAQHLDPFRPSNLQQILERRSTLPVVVVEESTKLEPGTVYVVPSNRHVAISDGLVNLEGDHGNRPRPSIDLLLSSAAENYGEHLVAVILTGTGSDGAAGAVEVKNAGGTVVIQNPETARYPSMPLALPPTAVDHIADLEQISALLYDLTRGVELPKPQEKVDDVLRDVLLQVNRRVNIDFRPYKPSTILRRISRRMAVTHTASLQDYAKYLQEHPEEAGELVMAFLIKVTEFFRDVQAFSYLKKNILPEIINRAREGHHSLRFWSAGCATGEEPYSLAILLADLLGAELPQWSIKIFATDLDEGAINFARRGLYPPNVLKNLPEDYRQRFFESVDHGYRISKALRQMLIFGQQDLSRGVPFPNIDLVVCRNLLIYFNEDLQQHVLDLFAFSLRHSKGYLFLGKAETVRPSKDHFEQIDKRLKVFRCVGSPQPDRDEQGLHSMPRSWLGLQAVGSNQPQRNRRIKVVERETPRQERTSSEIELGELRRFNDLIFRFLPTGVVVIDRHYRILTANPTARRLLSFRDLAHDQDFLHTIRGLLYAEVRAAIDTVFREHNTATLPEMALESLKSGEQRYLSLTVAPMQIESGPVDLATITIEDVTEQVTTRRRLETIQTEQNQLVTELSSANARLNELNKELQDANEELQASNEELLLAQEELQATNEELEATSEEVQATNEELETSNEELQATNEELETTNEELNERSNELQELTKSLNSEKRRLQEMVELAPFIIMVLRGPSFMIEAFNPRGSGLIGGREVIGQPFAEVFHEPEMAELVGLVREVYRQDKVQITPLMRRQMPDEHGKPAERFFVYTVVPNHDSEGQVSGAVIYAEDVSERVAREAEERREKLKLMVEHADQVALGLYDANTTELLQASPRYLDVLERAYGYPRDEIIARKWQELSFTTPNDGAAELFDSVIESRTSRRLPEVHIKLGQDEKETVWDCSLTPIPFEEAGKDGKVHFVAISAVEITEQVHARQELERVDRLKDEFLSLASHELRTPLVPLKGYSDLLARMAAEKENEPGWDKRIGELVGKFRKQLDHLNRLIDDLLDVSRLESGKFSLSKKPVDLTKVLEQAKDEVSVLENHPPIRLSVAEMDQPMIMTGDEERLVQVVVNLLENAVRYAADSKQIDLRLSRVREGGQPGAEKKAGKQKQPPATDQAQIEVQDYGRGIPPEDLSSLFTRFYQVNRDDRPAKSGLGLGLFICRQIVEQHGGTVTVSSAIGQGSTFTVRLPLVRSKI